MILSTRVENTSEGKKTLSTRVESTGEGKKTLSTRVESPSEGKMVLSTAVETMFSCNGKVSSRKDFLFPTGTAFADMHKKYIFAHTTISYVQ